ncbi:hypothetical protein MIND_01270100 [Mycena indigotica]|uniref:Uncharacterized protein n=1 Tax=Mycena indigotica TaxID=2126181 RepID=A0A8H6S2R9_9AGAR|nr:uncharacterized protein MIND_01270100 [Mycena indigotica]KAF7291263.1 hypothetical protein MIND_01270100 [Mycena indigotica]
MPREPCHQYRVSGSLAGCGSRPQGANSSLSASKYLGNAVWTDSQIRLPSSFPRLGLCTLPDTIQMPLPNITLLFGPMLIGVVLNVLLYGIMVTQMFKYYHEYPRDPKWIRYFMLYLFVLATAVVVTHLARGRYQESHGE